MTPYHMLKLVKLFAELVVEIVDAIISAPMKPGPEEADQETVIPWPFWRWMKPERIQGWLRQLGELLLEISEGITGEAETPENAE